MKFGVVKSSTINAIPGQAWNVNYILKMKERLDEKGREETPDAIKEEIASMRYEAMDRVDRARELSDQAERLMEQARAERAEAESLANQDYRTIERKMRR